MSDELRDLVKESQKITSHGARKRQTQFLAKIMRKEDDNALEAIRKTLTFSKEEQQKQTAEVHRAEAWRERLLKEGDEALAELISAHPHADRQHLRQLVRQAQEEQAKNKPPRAFRELYREIRELFTEELEAAEAEEVLEDDDFTHSEVEDFDDLQLNDEIDRDEQWERY
jgi:ribosome-associated protein